MLRFKVDPREIKTRELMAAEGNLSAMIALMARFVVDDAGERVPEDQAKEMLLDLDLDANQAAQWDFLAALTPRQKIAGR